MNANINRVVCLRGFSYFKDNNSPALAKLLKDVLGEQNILASRSD
jgi:hypothetical protein